MCVHQLMEVETCGDESVLLNIFHRHFWLAFLTYIIEHCFICSPSESTVSEDARIESIAVATLALTVRCTNLHLAKSHPQLG
jgi:hypothetical protein